jgi:hypothetical protein
MTEPNPTATTAAAPAPALASLETLAAWTKEVTAAFMVRYKKFLDDAPAPTRKAVLRILLESTDDTLRRVRGALNHANKSRDVVAVLQAGVAAFEAGNTQALSSMRDPHSGQPMVYSRPSIAVEHARGLGVQILNIRRDTPAQLERATTALKYIDDVLADVTSTPEDAIARVAFLETELAQMNATWQARIAALEARFDKVATGSSKAPKPPAKRRSRAKKASPPATPPEA